MVGEAYGVPVAGGVLQRLKIGQRDHERTGGGQLRRVVVGRQGFLADRQGYRGSRRQLVAKTSS
mgnify:CR=1 FL=1